MAQGSYQNRCQSPSSPWKHLFGVPAPPSDDRRAYQVRARSLDSAEPSSRTVSPEESAEMSIPYFPTSFGQQFSEEQHQHDFYSDTGYDGSSHSSTDGYGSPDPPMSDPYNPVVSDVSLGDSAHLQPSQSQNLQPQPSQQKQQSSRRIKNNGAKPFFRRSKAGNQHSVTPAGATDGFRCTFNEGGQLCSDHHTVIELPSKMREHLIEKHMKFSPFQCQICKRIFTRLALYTRHLHKQGTGDRVCPNQPVNGDEQFTMRNQVKRALWSIKTKQEEVDAAVELIVQYNGQLEGRRRRGRPSQRPSDRNPYTVSGQSPPSTTTTGALLSSGNFPYQSHQHQHQQHQQHHPQRQHHSLSPPRSRGLLGFTATHSGYHGQFHQQSPEQWLPHRPASLSHAHSASPPYATGYPTEPISSTADNANIFALDPGHSGSGAAGGSGWGSHGHIQ